MFHGLNMKFHLFCLKKKKSDEKHFVLAIALHGPTMHCFRFHAANTSWLKRIYRLYIIGPRTQMSSHAYPTIGYE